MTGGTDFMDVGGPQQEPEAPEKKKKGKLKPGQNEASHKFAAFWKGEVELVDKNNAKWHRHCKEIIVRYRDDRSRLDESSLRRMNLLWTNIQIMLPALLSKQPQAVAERRFLDQDPTGRLSAQMIERGLRNQIEEHDVYTAWRQAVLDYLLVGRGVVWLRYEPEFGNGDSLVSASNAFADLDKLEEEYGVAVDDEEEAQLEETGEEIVSEKVPVDYINWQDFYIFPAVARTWREVQAVGKKVYISREEAIKRFGDTIGKEIKPDTNPSSAEHSRSQFADSFIIQDVNARDIVIYEIWNKTDRRVYWISPGYDYLCDVVDDPLRLKHFFPVPAPLVATTTNDSMIPVPDYIEWQDQAMQIDELTQRLALLTKACKIAGTYDASNNGLKRLLDESLENQLIPVDSWAVHADRGGIPGSISLLPIKDIQAAIETLTEVRQQIKQDLDEVTGLSDIIRGTTDSRETLGGLRLKNNNAGTRLDDRRNAVARFCRDTTQIMAEIMCTHFSDDTLIESSGVLFEDALQPAQVMAQFQDEIWEEFQLTPEFQQLFGGGAGPSMGGPPSPAPPAQGSVPSPQQGAVNSQQGNVVPLRPGMQQPQQGPQQMPQMSQMMNGQAQQPQLQPLQQQFMQEFKTRLAQVKPEDIIKQKVKDALELLRSEIHKNYRIDIEVDSTIYADAMQERQDATEFIAAVGQYIGEAEQLGALMPEAVPLLGKLLQFGVRKFRVGRSLEAAFDDFVLKAEKKAKLAAQNPQPNPEMMKAQADIQKVQLQTQAKLQQDQQKAQLDMQVASQKAQVQAQNDQRDAQIKEMEAQRDERLQQMEMQREMAVEGMKMNIEKQKAGMEMQKMHTQAHMQHQEHQMNMQGMQQEHALGQQQMQHEHTMQRESHGMEMQKMRQQGQQQHMAHGQKMHEINRQAQIGGVQHGHQMEHMKAQHKQKMEAAKVKPTKPKGK